MAESASKPISVAKNESVVTVRLLGAVNTMTVKRFETGKDLVESVLKQYKKNHVKQTPRPDDIIGVLNVRTLRFLRLSSKAADQITSDMLWVITYEEWQEHRKTLEFDRPVTKRTAVMIPQHPSGLSKDKLQEFVDKYDVFDGEGDPESTLKSAIDGIETRPRDDILTYLGGAKHRLSILDVNKGSAKRIMKMKGGSPSSMGAETMSASESGESILRGSRSYAPSELSSSNTSSPSFLDATTPFIRRHPSARDKERPKRVASAAARLRVGSPDTVEADDENEGEEETETEVDNATPNVSVSVSSVRTASKPTPTPGTATKAPLRTPVQAPSSAQAPRTRPSVLKSVTLADLGTHHYSSASEGEGEGEGESEGEEGSINVRTPSVGGTSPSPNRRGSIVSLKAVPSSKTSDGNGDDGLARLRLQLFDGDIVLAAIPREQVPHFRNLASLEKTVLPDYSAIVKQLMDGEGGRDELEGQLAYHMQALEAERKANEVNLRSLRAEHNSIVMQMSEAHEQVLLEVEEGHAGALEQADSRLSEMKKVAEGSQDVSAASNEEKIVALQDLLDFERKQNTRREGLSEEALKKVRESARAEKAEGESRLAEMKAIHEAELGAIRETIEARQAVIRDHDHAKKETLQDKIVVLEGRLDEERLSFEQQRAFLASKAEEQKNTLEKLLEEERAASARALQSHREAHDERLAALKQHADGTIEYKLRVAEEQALEERQAGEERIKLAAQEHALAVAAARKAADQRYVALEAHCDDVLETHKMSAEERIAALKRLVEDERTVASEKLEMAAERHGKEVAGIKENEEATRRALVENHLHKAQISRSKQEELLARLDAVRTGFETKLEAQKQEYEDMLVRERARLEEKVAVLSDHHGSEVHSLRDVQSKKVQMLQDAQREHADRASIAEERLAAALLEHKKSLDTLKEEASARHSRLADSHAEALQERERTLVLREDQSARREKELRDAHDAVVGELRTSLEHEQEKYTRLSEIHRVVKRQTDEMVEAVAEPLRSTLVARDAEVAVLRASQEEAVALAVAKAREEHDAALSSHRDTHDEVVASKEEEKAALQQKHEAALLSHRELHAEVVAGKEGEKMAMQQRLEAALEALEEAHSEALAAKEGEKMGLLKRHEAALADLERQLEDRGMDHSRQVEAMKAAHADSIMALQEGHEAHVSTIKQAHDVQVTSHKAAHADTMASHEAQLQSLKSRHEKFLAESSAESDKKLESLTTQLTSDHEGVREVHEKALLFQQERLQQYVACYEELKSEMESKMARMRAAVEEASQQSMAKEEELQQTLRRVQLQEEMLAVHDKASASHKNDHKAAEERYLQLQRQRDDATTAAEESKAFITARFEERMATVQAQLAEERERAAHKVSSLEQEHRATLEGLQAQESQRRAAIEREHAVHVDRLKSSLDKHLETEQQHLMKKHSALGDQHQTQLSSLQESFNHLLSQEKAAAETERSALLKRLDIAERSAQAELEALRSEYDKQMASEKAQHAEALLLLRSEVEQQAENEAVKLRAEHQAALSGAEREYKDRVSSLETALREKEGQLVDITQEHSDRLDYVQKQMQQAIEAEGTNLVSITSPAVRMQHDAVNSSVVSHLSVDDDDDDDGDADSGAATEDSTSDAAGEETGDEEGSSPGDKQPEDAWAVPPDATSTSVAAGGGGSKGKSKSKSKSKGGGRRVTVAVPKGARLFTPPRAAAAAAQLTAEGEDPLDTALTRQAELEKRCQELEQRLAFRSSEKGNRRVNFGASSPDGTPETTKGDAESAPSTPAYAGTSTATASVSGSGGSASMLDVDALELNPGVLQQRLSEVSAAKWKLEVQRDAMQLKLRVVERKYQRIVTSLETKIADLKDMHAKAKEVIHTGYERRLKHGTRQQKKETDDLVASHAADKERLRRTLEENHTEVVRDQRKRHDEAEERRRELARSHETTVNAQEKALYSAQEEWASERGRLQAALSAAEGENKNLVAAVEEFRVMLVTGKRYEAQDPRFMSPRKDGASGTAADAVAASASASGRTSGGLYNQYTNLFRWVTEAIDDPAEKLLTRTSPSPFRIQRWKAAQETARKRADEKRGRGEAVDDDEIAETAYLEYYKGLESGQVSVDMAAYDPRASDQPSPRAQAALDDNLTLPVIYDNVAADGEESTMSNPMKMAVTKPAAPPPPATPRGGRLPRGEQLVLEVEEEIQQARASWREELSAMESHYLGEMEALKGAMAELRSENEKLPGLERDLRLTLALLEKNRDLALRWVQKKHERHRLERSAKKVISMWAHHVDTRHWAEVDPVSGKRTPSRSERRRKEREERNK